MSEQEPVKVVDRRWWARTEDTPASDSEPVVFDKPSYVQELEQKLAEKDAQLQEYVTLVHEAQREFDAMRARVRKDAARDAEMSRRSVFADLLEVIDNLDRALAAARAGGSADQLVQGVELVRQQFLHKLAGYGISRLEPLGEPFDPEMHEAVTVVPVTDQYGEGIVAGVAAPGYLIGDDVLRPATVAVAVGQVAQSRCIAATCSCQDDRVMRRRSEKHRGILPGASRLPNKEGDVSAWLPAAQPTAIGLPVGSLTHSLPEQTPCRERRGAPACFAWPQRCQMLTAPVRGLRAP